jgi:hypothetical protein
MMTVRTSIYATVAVVFGILLIGIIPSQIEGFNIFRPSPATQNLKGSMGGNESVPYNWSPQTDTFLGNNSAKSLATANGSRLTDDVKPALTSSPTSDLGYYSIWIVNVIIALLVYGIARKRLG